jgi:hypothetical protein
LTAELTATIACAATFASLEGKRFHLGPDDRESDAIEILSCVLARDPPGSSIKQAKGDYNYVQYPSTSNHTLDKFMSTQVCPKNDSKSIGYVEVFRRADISGVDHDMPHRELSEETPSVYLGKGHHRQRNWQGTDAKTKRHRLSRDEQGNGRGRRSLKVAERASVWIQ